MGWSSFEFKLVLRKRRLPLPQRRCRGRVCYRPHPEVLALSRIVEAGNLMAANAPRVPGLDVLLSESSANGCSRVYAAAISGFGLRAGIWACRRGPPRPITQPRTIRSGQLRTKTG